MCSKDFDSEGYLKLRLRDGHIIYSNEPEAGSGFILPFSESFLEKIGGQEGLKSVFMLNTDNNKAVAVRAKTGFVPGNSSAPEDYYKKRVVFDLEI